MSVDLEAAEKFAHLFAEGWAADWIKDLVAECRRLEDKLGDERVATIGIIGDLKRERDEARRQLAELQLMYDRSYANGWNDYAESGLKTVKQDLMDQLTVARETLVKITKREWPNGALKEFAHAALAKIGGSDA